MNHTDQSILAVSQAGRAALKRITELEVQIQHLRTDVDNLLFAAHVENSLTSDLGVEAREQAARTLARTNPALSSSTSED